MSNIHDHLLGRDVIALDTERQTKRIPADFPGWDAADAADRLLPIPAGLTGVITSVESHGSHPYTRYAVRFGDGSHAPGLVLGEDIELHFPPAPRFEELTREEQVARMRRHAELQGVSYEEFLRRVVAMGEAG